MRRRLDYVPLLTVIRSPEGVGAEHALPFRPAPPRSRQRTRDGTDDRKSHGIRSELLSVGDGVRYYFKKISLCDLRVCQKLTRLPCSRHPVQRPLSPTILFRQVGATSTRHLTHPDPLTHGVHETNSDPLQGPAEHPQLPAHALTVPAQSRRLRDESEVALLHLKQKNNFPELSVVCAGQSKLPSFRQSKVVVEWKALISGT